MRRGMAKNTDLTKSNHDVDDTMTPMHGNDDIDDGGGCDINSDESDQDGEETRRGQDTTTQASHQSCPSGYLCRRLLRSCRRGSKSRSLGRTRSSWQLAGV